MEKLRFGVATAAYQIEGGVSEDGRTPSVWDVFSHIPGNVLNGDTGDIACDHYHRWKEDVALMKEMGVQMYRFSLSWSRILPEGIGEVNEKGIAFYEALLMALREAGIQTCVTLYHWDLPQILHERGGWNNLECIKWFCEYAKTVFRRLGDKVDYFMTFNEIYTFTTLGYKTGIFAPGIRNERMYLQAVHNVLLAHGETVRLFRREGLNAKIGLALDVWPRFAQTAECEQAARLDNAKNHYWIVEPILKGEYPAEARADYERRGVMPKVSTEEMKIISEKLDYIGLNYYSSEIVGMEDGRPTYLDYTSDKTDFGWKVYPEGMYRVAKELFKMSGLPIVISENGMADADTLVDGKVHDKRRIAYIRAHVGQVQRLRDEGVDVMAYLYWSLLDNFEWASGYSKRFGLVYVDYATQKRYLKDSAIFYKKLIKTGGKTDEL